MVRSPLLPEQIALLEKARSLHPDKPPPPWDTRIVVAGGGIIAAGWDSQENVLLISFGGGISLTEARTGKRLMRDRNTDHALSWLSIADQTFTLPGSKTPIPVFGLYGGDGIYTSPDWWTIEFIYPWWPQEAVVLCEPGAKGTGSEHYFDQRHLLDLSGIAPENLHGGFSRSGQHLMIFSSSGAVVFSRSALSK